MAFANAKLISLLSKRGDIIKNERWKEMPEIERKINHQKDEHLDNFAIPASIFITFENEEGINRAKDFEEGISTDPDNLSVLRKLMPRSSTSGRPEETYFEIGEGKDIEIKEASEPTDIIWENRQATKMFRTK
jgi:hypothetical protein